MCMYNIRHIYIYIYIYILYTALSLHIEILLTRLETYLIFVLFFSNDATPFLFPNFTFPTFLFTHINCILVIQCYYLHVLYLYETRNHHIIPFFIN